MVLNINGRTIQTFGASRMVQGEHRAEPVEFRLSMPGASGLSWYLGYERADNEGNGVVPLEVHGSDDDLRLVWFPTRTATDVVGKLAIIVYGLEGEVTEEGDDRRWSTYPAYLTVSAGLDVTQAEEIEPSVLESYLVRFQKLLSQTSALRDAVAIDKTKVAEYVAEADTSATTASQKAEEAKGYADTAKAEREATEAVKTAVEAKATEVEGKASEVVSEVAKAKGYSDSASASASGASASASSARGYAATAEREAETATQKASQAHDHAESARGYAASAESLVGAFDGKVNTAKSEIETAKDGALGSISAAISGVDAKRAEAVAELDQKKTEIEGVYQEDLGRLTSSLTDLSQNIYKKTETYTKTEVDTLVDGATPKDYEEVKDRVAGIDDRLNYHDFRKVDKNATFVLDGDGEASLKQMMDSVEAYPQDAIMLSLEPIIPTASTHNFGIRGQIACDDSYLYVCIAENTWKKIPLTNL